MGAETPNLFSARTLKPYSLPRHSLGTLKLVLVQEEPLSTRFTFLVMRVQLVSVFTTDRRSEVSTSSLPCFHLQKGAGFPATMASRTILDPARTDTMSGVITFGATAGRGRTTIPSASRARLTPTEFLAATLNLYLVFSFRPTTTMLMSFTTEYGVHLSSAAPSSW
ncbi:hypothetical protein F7725_002636 [Dissostichus mawsoni]|uniref:Uncharacterized protein n=1 Tax=Dissostichus mawsoni TaxID=36200 RepID=A0A7J5Y559_DISMA|nr:hypothetical protein F7725_002636 [Dissostichus mawsoni]